MIAAWRHQLSSAFMNEEGVVMLDGLRRIVSDHVEALENNGKPKMTPERVAEIRAVEKLVGTFTEEQLIQMMQKLNISREEYEYVTKKMDTDIDL